MLILACFCLARTDTDPLLRIAILVLGLILVRDAMTPAGLWDFGVVDGVVPWIRMTDNPVLLLALGIGSLILVAATLSDTSLRALVWWGKPIEVRGGVVAITVLPALAFMTLAGNLLEEVLFRGYLQGRLVQVMTPVRDAVLSGMVFAACHMYLASTVTSVGWPLLAFTLWEGLICAVLRLRRGVIPAVVAHGLAIFLLASGLV